VLALGCGLAAAWLLPGCGCSEVEIVGVADASVDAEPEIVEEPVPGCGNGIAEGAEECDDGDDDDCNGCTTTCTREMAMHVEGREPGALILSGEVPTSVESPFTVEFWFRLDEPGSTLSVLNAGGPAYVAVGVDEYLWTFCDVDWFSGEWPDGSLEIDTWYHFAYATWHEGPLRFFAIFLDGEVIGGTGVDVEPTGLFSGTAVEMGNMIEGIGSGAMDDVRISDDALYTSSSAPFTPARRLEATAGTVALWDFDRVVEDVVPDVSGNGHDAVLLHGRFVPDECHGP
jgi:cysteine-rich repeat protein